MTKPKLLGGSCYLGTKAPCKYFLQFSQYYQSIVTNQLSIKTRHLLEDGNLIEVYVSKASFIATTNERGPLGLKP